MASNMIIAHENNTKFMLLGEVKIEVIAVVPDTQKPLSYAVSVGSLRFTFEYDRQDLVRMFQNLQENDLVQVEYSPNTKHIWTLQKI